MVTTVREKHLPEYDQEREEGYNRYKIQRYGAGQSAGLSDLDLQVGDALPTDATYVIVASEIVHDAKGGRMASVTALLEINEAEDHADTAWAELAFTRKLIEDTVRHVEYEITFSAPTGTTRPALGTSVQAWCKNSDLFVGDHTTLDAEPEAVVITFQLKATPTNDHCVVRFRAFYVAATASSVPLWHEMQGTRQIVADTTEYQEWEVQFVGLTVTASPTPGNAVTDICNTATAMSATAPTPDLDGVPELMSFQRQAKATPTKDILVARFRAYYVVATATSGTLWHELRGGRRIVTDTVQYQEWEVRFIGLFATLNPEPGDIITAVCDKAIEISAITPTPDLDEAPELVSFQRQANVTPTKDILVTRFRAYYEAIAAASPSYWDELRGTRRLAAETAHEREWEIRFSAATATSLPVNGGTLASVTGDVTDLLASATPATDGLAREPVIVDVAFAKQVLVLRDHIIVRFRASKTRGTNPQVG